MENLSLNNRFLLSVMLPSLGALVEEASSSSQAVSEQTMSLSKMVEFFRTNEGDPMSMASNEVIRSPSIRTASNNPQAVKSKDEWEDF